MLVHKKLDNLGDPLIMLSDNIPWGDFRLLIKKARDKLKKSPAGCKPLDEILLFKSLILGSLYNLSDEKLEYQIQDRISFQRFLGLTLECRAPDRTTIWLFREMLTKSGMLEKLFEKFNNYLNEQGYKAKEGQIIDARIVEVPKQRNTRDENKQIKSGETPEHWSKHKSRQKDTQARWAKKNISL